MEGIFNRSFWLFALTPVGGLHFAELQLPWGGFAFYFVAQAVRFELRAHGALRQ